MPDVREFQKLVESAEKAAAAGDLASAEAWLREAAELQEASHGPLHPDLASTFNNLAVVCEMAHKPGDAEQFYRRAYAIASRSLSPGHPMVATARDNLRDFCIARGLPLDEWRDMSTGTPVTPSAPPVPPMLLVPAAAALPAVATPLSVPAMTSTPLASAAPPAARVAPPAPSTPRAARVAPPAPAPAPPPASPAPRAPRPAMPAAPAPAAPSSRRGLAVAVAIVAVLAALAIARMSRTPTSDGAAPSGTAASPEPPARDSVREPAPAPAPGAADAAAPAGVTPPVAAVTPAPSSAPAPAPASPAAPAAASAATGASPSPGAAETPAGIRVVTATVCAALTTGGAWRCTAAEATAAPGRLSYYTRVASPRGLRVRHRWYQGDRLRQDVALNLGANAADGYRTFSRQTVAPGEWRVELRAENGTVLHEARFVVR